MGLLVIRIIKYTLMAQKTQGNHHAVMVTKLGGEFLIPTCAGKLP
jgi:hypothetical protein